MDEITAISPTLPSGQAPQESQQLTPELKQSMTEMMSEMMEAMQENIWKKLDEYLMGSDADHDGDVALNDASNASPSHPPLGEFQTQDVVDNYLEEPQRSRISWENVSQEFSVAEKTGPIIDERLAKLVNDLVTDKLPKAKIDELITKYPRPENCPLLVAPKCNRAVWHQLKPATKATDTSMQKCQRLIVASIRALIQATAKASEDIKPSITHALVLALSANGEFNQKRRDLLRPHLNVRYSALCNPSTPITTELFGDDIGKEIDDLTKTSKIGLKLSTPRKDRARCHPYSASFRGPTSSSTFKRREDRALNARVTGLQSFFGDRSFYRRKPGGKTGNTQTRTAPY